jgi:hypothetical protein
MIRSQFIVTHDYRQLLRLAEHDINRPAAANVLLCATAMRKQLLIVATGIEKGISKDRQAVECPFSVNAFGNAADRRVIPCQYCLRQLCGRREPDNVPQQRQYAPDNPLALTLPQVPHDAA